MSVPPRLYGGTERIVSYLTEELVRLGHDVTLFASGDSITSAELALCCTRALRLDPTVRDSIPHFMLMVDKVRERAKEFDVLHFHIDFFHFPLFRSLAARTLTTLHGRQDLADLKPFYSRFGEMPLVSISHDQRKSLPHANFVATIHHGIPADLHRPSFEQGRYLAFLGRISPEKRPDRAIRIARATGMPLKIAAKVDKVDEDYFRNDIFPLIDGPGVEFIGEINEREKTQRRTLRNSRQRSRQRPGRRFPELAGPFGIRPELRSRIADEDAGEEDQDAPDHDLEGGLQERRIHIARADPGDHDQLDRYHDEGERGGGVELRNEIGGKRMAETADRGHHAAYRAAHHRRAAAGQRAVIGQGFGEGHGDAGADRGGKAFRLLFFGSIDAFPRQTGEADDILTKKNRSTFKHLQTASVAMLQNAPFDALGAHDALASILRRDVENRLTLLVRLVRNDGVCRNANACTPVTRAAHVAVRHLP